MNEGQKILLKSFMLFGVLSFVLLAFGFFVYPNLDTVQKKVEQQKYDVLSVVDQENPYAFECPGNYKTVNVPEDFSTIQEAINSVRTEAIINVAPGVYNETIVLRPNICLIAQDYGKTEIQGFSDTVIKAKNNNQIKNFIITSLGKADVGISVINAEMVNISVNSFNNLKYGVLSKQDSKVSINSNSFRNVDFAITIEDSAFFAMQNNIEVRNIGVNISNSEGEIIGKVINGGQYGVKCNNSKVFFDRNIFKNQSVVAIELSLTGDYELGNNFFENVNEEILYK